MEKEELIREIQGELRRINCPAYQLDVNQERMSFTHKKEDPSVQRISWPHPIGLEPLLTMLRNLPTDASPEEINRLTGLYSLGFHQGRENMLQSPEVRDAYYRDRGILPKLQPLENSPAEFKQASTDSPAHEL